jgi:GNAT superfamily N-acetyltransferase
MQRNDILLGDWRLTPLITADDYNCCNAFDCGNIDLNEFFIKDGLAHKKELLATVYCMHLDADAIDIPAAFISFTNDAVKTTTQKNRQNFLDYLHDTLPRGKKYDFLPAVKIGRLGVVKSFQGKNIGSHLLNMTKKLFVTNNRTGCRFLTVDAYNTPEVIRFYTNNDFQCLHDIDKNRKTRIMFFDLKRFIQ